MSDWHQAVADLAARGNAPLDVTLTHPSGGTAPSLGSSQAARCPCCGVSVTQGPETSELCPACANAMETGVDPDPQPQRPPAPPYPATKTLLAINVGVFVVLIIALWVWPEASTSVWWGLVDWGPFTLSGQVWRLFTSTFIHVSVGHLLANLLLLWILGRRAERTFGTWSFLFFYISCGIAGSLASMAAHPEVYSLGASAGVFGLAGGLISAFGLKALALSVGGRWKLALLVLWTAYSVYPSAEVDNAAHAGGLLTGLILGALLSPRFAATIKGRWVFTRLAVLLLLAYVGIRFYHDYAVPLGDGIRALNRGSAEEALRAIKIALQKKPDSMLANVLAAEAYLKKEDYANTETAVRHALAIDRDDFRATYLLGLAKLHTGYCEEAHQIGYHLLARSDARHADEVWSLAIAPCDVAASGDHAFAEGEPNSAIAFYNLALREKPDNIRALRGLAKAYEATGKQNEADAAAARVARIQVAQHPH
jgi:membrane associated rhomboid family serine protease